MPDAREESKSSKKISRNAHVNTPDGVGIIVGFEQRKNTNSGPGTWQYRIKLDDGRVRHYSAAVVYEIK